MANKQDATHHIFNNHLEDFEHFRGTIIRSEQIKDYDFKKQKIAIIGIDQHVVSELHHLCQVADNIMVYQIKPQFVLPRTERLLNKLIQHPLIAKNRRLFSNRIKSILAIRFLEDQVPNHWLRHLLSPNTAIQNKTFLKSDHYYAALQQPNCILNTWPIAKIQSNSITALDEHTFECDVIVRSESNQPKEK
ncbi:flavoprotein [Acinetobacter sp. ANC 5579]|uniref:flavoprotein n=1 Tax=Acinetobacter amyesii TaxID=2942470 RepID=UPI0020BF44DB|nr:flavoprotein [Acinetobacter amyesii]MCL6236065.1 flavoprotein [Acinetobacter amyesii]